MPHVTLKGNPVVLNGKEIKVGDTAPDFNLQDQALNNVSLSTYAGKKKILVTVPSLDTGVCAIETKKFNDEAAKHSDVVILVISTDLPFGQKRWCGAENVSNVITLSDHRMASFGDVSGTVIKAGPLERCLCRAVFVVDAHDKITHVEYVGEITTEPNYEAILAAVK